MSYVCTPYITMKDGKLHIIIVKLSLVLPANHRKTITPPLHSTLKHLPYYRAYPFYICVLDTDALATV